MIFEPQQIDARITILADKLGIERAELWSAIVKQAKVEAWTDTALAVLGLAMVVTGFLVLRRTMLHERQRDRYDWEGISILAFALAAGALLAGFIICAVNAYAAAQIFPNPIYYAYTHLVF